jgi:hypothetical protein
MGARLTIGSTCGRPARRPRQGRACGKDHVGAMAMCSRPASAAPGPDASRLQVHWEQYLGFTCALPTTRSEGMRSIRAQPLCCHSFEQVPEIPGGDDCNSVSPPLPGETAIGIWDLRWIRCAWPRSGSRLEFLKVRLGPWSMPWPRRCETRSQPRSSYAPSWPTSVIKCWRALGLVHRVGPADPVPYLTSRP